MFKRYSHLPKALSMAAKSGRFGPSISEKDQFHNVLIPAARQPKIWPRDQRCDGKIRQEKAHQKWKTTAFVALHEGKIIREYYALGGGPDEQTNSFSMAKSIVATIIGRCLRLEKLHLEDSIGTYLPRLHPSLHRVTIQHLLSMSTGIEWDESAKPTSDNAKAYYGSDIRSLFLNLRAKEPPGKIFEYVSVATQLLAESVLISTGKSVDQWVSDSLWPVLGAEHDAYWNLDHDGGTIKAFCCFYATARDFARLGQLYLNQGAWDGTAYLDVEFVAQAVTPTHTYNRETQRQNNCYGWHWWHVEHRAHRFFYARGIRGQYIICCEAIQLVVVRLGHLRNKVDTDTGHPPDLFHWIDEALDFIK